MSRLFTAMRTAAEIADHFETEAPSAITVPLETIEGNPGLIVIERRGRRIIKSLPWGFPRHTREMRLRGDPPGRIGLVADLTNPMWDTMVADPRYRCLIPLTHFANPDGDPGEKTRTWFSVRNQPLVAWAGFYRTTEEFGPVFAGMTMAASEAVMPYNDRMPVLLAKSQWERWLRGSIRDVMAFQFRRPMPSELLEILNTDDYWKGGKLPPQPQSRNSSCAECDAL